MTKQNNIYEINVNKTDSGTINLQLKGDYKENFQTVKENKESVYFDIKNARLAEGFKTDYKGDLSVVAQQIGSKVRVYLKGENSDKTHAIFVAPKGFQPVDYNKAAALCGILGLLTIVAIKSCSATIRLAKADLTVKTPIKAAGDLNRQLCEFGKRKSPELVLSASNPIKQQNEVYDFQFAKDKKNIKIAI